MSDPLVSPQDAKDILQGGQVGARAAARVAARVALFERERCALVADGCVCACNTAARIRALGAPVAS